MTQQDYFLMKTVLAVVLLKLLPECVYGDLGVLHALRRRQVLADPLQPEHFAPLPQVSDAIVAFIVDEGCSFIAA